MLRHISVISSRRAKSTGGQLRRRSSDRIGPKVYRVAKSDRAKVLFLKQSQSQQLATGSREFLKDEDKQLPVGKDAED